MRSSLTLGLPSLQLQHLGGALVEQVQTETERQGNEPPPGAPTQGALDMAYLSPEGLDGHLCRCTGYQGLLAALDRAATGTSSGTPHRLGGHERARGETVYAADAAPPGTLTGLLLTCRSPHALVTIEPGTAMDVPGAVAVLGPQHSPQRRFATNPHLEDPILAPAEEMVFAREGRWVGDIVGLVVAESPSAAREMARRIEQTERPLPAVTEPGPSAKVAFDLAIGSTQADFTHATTQSSQVVSQTFDIVPGPPAAMERPAAVAVWEDDRLTLWSTSQTPQVVRRRVAAVLDLAPEQVEVEPVALGGGFGLKEEVFLEPAAALAARITGRPVCIEVTREQLGRLRRRHGGRITVTTGCSTAGTMLARHVDVTLDAGGAVGHSALVLENMLMVAATLYPAPVVRASGRVLLTNTTNSAAFRGYGATEVVFAVDSHVDELAGRFGHDPLDYRRRHVLSAGGMDALNGWEVASFAAHACLDALLPDRGNPLVTDPTGRWKRGRGMSVFALVSAASSAAHLDRAAAEVWVDARGDVVIGTVVPDLGSGLHTTLTGVVAERMTLPQTRVRVEQLPSSTAPQDEGTFATRGVYVTANAVADAAGQLQQKLVAAAADLYSVPVESVSWSPTGIQVNGHVLPLAALAGTRAGGGATAPDNGLVAGAQMVDVAVDTRTGRIVVERVVSAHDVGRVLDTDLARGQVVGGVVQGIGIATTERQRHHDGEPMDVHLLDQAIPTAHTAPEVVDLYVGDGLARGHLRAKGLGEAPVVGIPAAIANAVRDATGVRLTGLPMDPETVLAALDRKAAHQRP